MNRTLRRWSLPTLALVLVAATAPALPAQVDGQARARTEAPRAHAYVLENADPSEISALFSRVFASGSTPAGPDVRVSSDERTNTVVVFGPESVHGHVAVLLETLDRKIETGSDRAETRIIPLRHNPIDTLREVVTLHQVSVAMNRATNSYIVRGTTSEIDRLEQSLTELDVPRTAVEVDCWILEQGRGSAVAEDPDLSAIEATLRKAGLEGYGVLSRTRVAGIAGEPFESGQSFQNRRLRSISLDGTVRLVDDGRIAQMDFGLTLQMNLEDADQTFPGPSQASGTVQVQTELRTEPGKLIVAGLAPTGDENSKPLVVVLRISK